ncbi:MAG: VIT domain-containing protein [Thermoanaerobaculia bacterium]
MPSKNTTVPAAMLIGLALLTTAGAGLAQGWIEPRDRWGPTFQVERVRSDVRVTVDGESRVARVEVEEVFRNRSHGLAEGDYLYPIPSSAVFTNFSLFMGDQELKGEVLSAEEARKIYEEIVRRKKDPALIELVGHGVLRARVFPIEPGDSRRVILRYTQVLGRDGDTLRLRYPRIVGILPGTETREVFSPPRRPEASQPFTLTVRVPNAARFSTPYSPTHAIEVRERRRDEIEIAHRSEGDSRDFELFLPLREALVGASLVAHAGSGEDGYFMLLLSPPAVGEEVQIPRDVTLVCDVSGSMSGGKLEQARDAMDQILGGLRREDRFRLITFSSGVRSFRREFVRADRGMIDDARDFLYGVRAEGSTNVIDALREALAPEVERGRLSLIVFLTDGKPTIGETDPERIAREVERLRDGERVFAFGVGYDVNTYLLDRMAAGGRGTVSYVRPGDDVEEAVFSLTRKIGHPALSDLRIVRAPVELEDHYPGTLPDLFFGEELVLFGRYRGHGAGELVVEGSRAGETQRFRYQVELPRRENENDFIPRLWAARKAGALTAQVRLHGPNPELVEEIRQLGLRYGIITEYTSYLVEEPMLAVGLREPLPRRRPMLASPAPRDQTGAVAFESAAKSSLMREVDRLDDADSLTGDSVLPGAARQIGRRAFVLRDGVWTDVGFEAGLRTIEVAPYSQAYFELVRRLPALKTYFALSDRLVIVGEGVALELSAGGVTKLSSSELEAVVEGLDGSL